MRKLVAASVASMLMSLGAVAGAQAQISPTLPTGKTIVTLSGGANFAQSVELDCNVSMAVEVDAGGLTGRVTAFTLSTGDTGCGSIVVPNNLPWPVTYQGPGHLRISGIASPSLFGSCYNGVVDVYWPTPSPSAAVTFTSNGFTIPGWQPWPFSRSCRVDGAVVVTSSTGGLPVSVL